MADPTGPREPSSPPEHPAPGCPPPAAAPAPPYNYKLVLQKAVQTAASDLHLKVGRPPMIRLNGELSSLELPPLKPEDLESIGEQICPPKQKREFDAEKETELGERLDPEALRTLLSRHFSSARAVLERHGGTVEKFIGDAVMAVFGIPVIHEDDALRAVRAALELQAGVRAINAEIAVPAALAVRIGINTGEVVTGVGAGETLVTGDTVNTAARLEQAARPGEILIGPDTHDLVRDAVEVEAMPPLALKGKAVPIGSFRVISVVGNEGHRRNIDAPMVGRAAEFALLMDAWRATRDGQAAQLTTVLATAGVGKSRLIRELASVLEPEATIGRGRCLPYGDGITYWPVRELVHSLAGIEESDSKDAALQKIADLLPAPCPQEVRDGVAAAVGLETRLLRHEEIFWAVRRTLETVAERRPLLVLIEDLHWAEETLLDLLEFIVEMALQPMLIVATARPELMTARPGWGGTPSSTLLRLNALPSDDAGDLLRAQRGAGALPPELQAQILDSADGNALYIEEIVGLLREREFLIEADGDWRATGSLTEITVPPTIHALLAARLDQLPEGERSVAQHGAVVGRSFEAAALLDIGPDAIRTDLARRLLGLVRKELIRPERSQLSDGDAYRFRHILIRDAAYAALSKGERSTIHEKFATWLARTAGDRSDEFAEIVGFHLQEAARYHGELGNDRAVSLRASAAPWFLRAGSRARLRDDPGAAEALLRTCADLAAGADPATEVTALTLLGDQLLSAARLDEADGVLTRAFERATATGDTRAAAHVRLSQTHLHHHTHPSTWVEETRIAAADAIGIFTAAGDELGLARAWGALSVADQNDPARAAEATARHLYHAQRAGDPRELAMAIIGEAISAASGETPVAEALPRARELLALATGIGRGPAADLGMSVALLEAMAEESEQSREHIGQSLHTERELGLKLDLAFGVIGASLAYQYLGDPAAAEVVLREGLDLMDVAGEQEVSAYLAGRLAMMLALMARYEEAEDFIERARASNSADELVEANWRSARSRVEAARGNGAAAIEHAERVLAIVDPKFLSRYALALMDLAVARQAAGQVDDARATLQSARAVAERKGNLALLRMVDRELTALSA